MLAKLYLICTLSALGWAGNFNGFSDITANVYGNKNLEGYRSSGYGNYGRNGWNSDYNNGYSNNYYYPGKFEKYPNAGLNGWGGYNGYNRYNGYNEYNGYNPYNSGATSYANFNLQSYSGNGYDYGKYGGYNRNGYYYNNYGNPDYPRYNFKYSVNDNQTGDRKYHQEQRDGDRVWGSYGLKESDGTTREVKYDADDKNGFNVVVTKSGVAQHPY